MGAKATAGDQAGGGRTGPLRLCAVSRVHKPPEELIRFVLGPDGTIVPDLARRLPGRGVWVERHTGGGDRRGAPQGLRAQPEAGRLPCPTTCPTWWSA